MMELDSAKEKICKILSYIAIGMIFLFGIYIRVRFYLSRYPLWLDETMLAYNFTDRSLLGIFAPLDAFQKAPPLFSFLVILLRKLFGINELTLRFIPCVAGCASLFGFYLLLKRYIQSGIGRIIGFGFYALCIPLVYFSAEFKPYGVDAFFCILLLLLFEKISLKELTSKKILLYVLGTIGFIFLSFPTIFIIPAIVVAKMFQEKVFKWQILWIFAGILLSGLILFLSDINSYLFLKDYWGAVEHGFGLTTTIKSLLIYMNDTCFYYIYNLKEYYSAVILILFLTGFGLMLKKQKEFTLYALLIILFTIAASIIQVYPLKPKLTLFLAPVYVLFTVKIFDIQIKNKILGLIFNAFFAILLIVVIGVNIPYVNITSQDLAYYNKSLQSRNKSVEDRTAVKEFCLKLLSEADTEEEILASQEFIYSLKYYKHNIKTEKELNANSFETLDTRRSLDVNKITEDFIQNNLNKKFWLFGRDNEWYFHCPESNTIRFLLNKYQIKYLYFNHNDIYLFQIKGQK